MKTLRPLTALFLLSASCFCAEAQTTDSLPAVPDSVPRMRAASASDAAQFAPVLTLDAMVTAPSPEAAAMNRHLDEGMDYATGTASLSVPLFSWDSGEIPMALSLDYRIGAYKLDEQPGWFGLGWNLSGTGCVTRHINGFPDGQKKQSIRPASSISADTTSYKYLQEIGDYKVDAALDSYSYSCPAGSGSFCIEDGVIVPMPETDCRISFAGNAVDGVHDFMVTAPDGTAYVFAEREHVDYTYRPAVLSPDIRSPNYSNAVNAWYLSKIIAPEGADSVLFAYDTLPARTQQKAVATRSVTGTRYVPHSGLGTTISVSDQSPYHSYANTTYRDAKVLRSITGRTATVEFTHAMIPGVNTESSPVGITGMTVKATGGETVRDITFTQGVPAGDRRVLKVIEVKSSGVLLDRHDFQYMTVADKRGKDFFGYANGKKKDTDNMSVIDPNTGALNEQRATNTATLPHLALTYHKTALGVETRYRYEPATAQCIRKRGQQTDTISVTIGLRLKSISDIDPVTNRERQRSFKYSQAVCDIDFSDVAYGDFVSLSGTNSYVPPSWSPNLHLIQLQTTATFLDGSRGQGSPIENARIYHGKVEELLSGTGIDTPVRTVYEYDCSPCMLAHSPSYGRNDNSAQIFPSLDNLHFEGLSLPPNAPEGFRKALELSVVSSGCFRERPGSAPLLRKKTTFRHEGSGYEPESEESFRYLTIGKGSLLTAVYAESLIRERITSAGTTEHLHTSSSQFNYSNAYVDYDRRLCDTLVSITHFPDGSSRSAVSTFQYSGIFHILGTVTDPVVIPDSINPVLPGNPPAAAADTISDVGSLPLLLSVRTESGGHTTEHYTARAQNVRGSTIFTDACMHGRRSLPVLERWVVDGRDTITRHYEYGVFRGVTRPTAVALRGRGGALMDRITVGGYTAQGRPLSTRRLGNPPEHYGWGYTGDLLTALTLGDPGAPQLTTTFTHIPLIGCTSVIPPDGSATYYSYTGSRLTSENDNAGRNLRQYEYALYADGFSGGLNYVKTSSRLTDTRTQAGQPSVTAQYYDGFGLPAVSLSEGYGTEGDVATVTRYDALHRPVRQWVPLPATATVASLLESDSDLSQAATATFSDPLAYASTAYPHSASDMAARSSLPGSDFAGAASTQTLTCSTTQMRDNERAVLRYTFDGATLRTDGYYARGELSCLRATDADGRVTLTFTDVLGRTVLQRRVISEGNYADTYTVSDSWGNPLIVLPPEASAELCWTPGEWTLGEEAIDRYAFVYSYDGALRPRSAKLPGCAPTEYAYSSEGRLAYSRNGNQRAQGRRAFVLYDMFGREAVTGLCDDALSDDIWESDLSAVTEPPTAVPCGVAGNGFLGSGYTAGGTAEPEGLTGATLLTATYYDSWGFAPSVPQAATSGLSHPFGRVTGSLTAVLADSVADIGGCTRVLSVTGYDLNGNPCYSSSDFGAAGTVEAVTANSRAGLPLRQEVTLMRGDSTVARYATRTLYDTFGRPVETWLSYGEGADERLVYTATLDAVGRTASETTGGVTRTMRRDVRGAVTSWATPYITQRLLYGAQAARPSYTGRVTGRVTTAYGHDRRYDYTYDALGFLTEARYSSTDSVKDFTALYAYDRQANLTSMLQRNKMTALSMRQLPTLIVREGNRVKSVSVNGILKPSEPVIGPSVPVAPNSLIEGEPLPLVPWAYGPDYGYDANGNLTHDRDRSIAAIAYNAVDRPKSVRFANGDVTRYVYSATGERLAEVHASRDGLSDTRRLRMGAFCFSDGRLERTELPQGYLDTLGTLHSYIPDFQGNIVGVCREGGGLEQFTDYYPYGTPHPDARHPEANRRKYGGKELLTEGGLNEHDFEARRLTPLGSFSQPDPLAGTLTDPETGDRLPVPYLCHISPYAYCAADPINLTDPTGLYVTDNLERLATCPILCVYPDFSKLDLSDPDVLAIYHDYQAAAKADVPMIMVEDVADFKNAMTEVSGKLFSPETIVFNSHGVSGKFYIGDEAVNSASDLSRLNKELNGKTVVVSACDVGIDQSGSRGDIFTEVLAEQTNSTVITSLHKVPVGSKYDGGTLNNRNLSSPDFNAYRISYRGTESSIITDVSVHKTIGVRWKSNPFGVFSNIFPK